MAGASKESPKSLRDRHPDAIPLTGGVGPLLKWDKPGMELEGKFYGLREGSMGGQIGTLDTGTEVISFSAPAMLAGALDGVKIGQRVAIRYIGEQKNKKGTDFKVFEAVALK